MKELSIEEKAKRYDKALEIANAAYKDEDRHLKATLERIFPVLKESEDERIREALIDGFTVMKESKNCGKTFSDYHIPVADILAWLEKQGQKDSQVKLPTFTFYDVLALQCCMETVKKVQEDKDLYNELLLLHNKVHDAYTITKR